MEWNLYGSELKMELKQNETGTCYISKQAPVTYRDVRTTYDFRPFEVHMKLKPKLDVFPTATRITWRLSSIKILLSLGFDL